MRKEHIYHKIKNRMMNINKIYNDEIDYLNTIREIVIDYDDDSFDPHDIDFTSDLISDLTNETGEYILDFDYEILVDQNKVRIFDKQLKTHTL